MPFDATAFGYVSTQWDNLDVGNEAVTRVGGYCVWGTLTSTGNLNDIVIVDSSADNSFTTTTSANSTAVGAYVVAQFTNGYWDFQTTAISAGAMVLVCIKGIVKATASTAISRGARVGTSTTAGQVVTTTTQDAAKGIAMTAATTQGDTIYVLV